MISERRLDTDRLHCNQSVAKNPRAMASTEPQLKALAITPKITSSFSIICSVLIIKEVIADHRRNKGKVTLRALLGMSIIDVMASSGWFLSTWMAPVGSNAVYAAGNTQTCTYQGFLLQIAIGAPMYNSCLALYYLLTINYGWREERLQRLERWLHAFVLIFAFGTGILLIPLNVYNHIGAVCWVVGLPKGCENSNYQPSDVPCERGNDAWKYGFALFYVPLWVCIIFTTIAMIMIYRKVRETEKRSSRYAGSSTARRRTFLQSDRVAAQAILYTFAFYITWLPSTIWSLTWWSGSAMFWLDFLATITEPSQGSMNLFVFLRPRPGLRARLKRRFLGSNLSEDEISAIELLVDGTNRGSVQTVPRREMSSCRLDQETNGQDVEHHHVDSTTTTKGLAEQPTNESTEHYDGGNDVAENENYTERHEH